MNPRMVITGGYGFIGSAFVSQARSMFDLSLIHRTKKTSDDIVWDMAGLAPGLPAAPFIVHLASATAKSANDTTTLADYRRQNVETTKTLFSSLVSKPSYILYVSTGDVYGKNNGLSISEDTPTNPLTPYAISKLEAEAITASYCRAHNIPFGIARLGFIYGPGEGAYQKAIPVFIQRALSRKPILLLGEGKAKRQFLYVDDCACALMQMVLTQTPGVVNVVGKHSISIADLAKLINLLTHNPAGVTKSSAAHPEVDVLYDCRKLSGIGCTESVSLSEGLQKEIEWFDKARKK